MLTVNQAYRRNPDPRQYAIMVSMSRATAVRGMSLVAGIAVCAWFAVGIRQAHDTAAASAILSGGSRLSPAGAARASSLLDGAALLSPDRQVGLLRAELAAERGQRALAQRLALRVAHAEPRNSQAWLLLSSIGTPYEAAVAVQRLAKIAPTVRSTP
jgi:hypothetical protein